MNFDPDNPAGTTYAVVFVAWTGIDWMATVSRDMKSGDIKIDYRFRHYDPYSTDIWDHTDQKRWTHGVVVGVGMSDQETVRGAIAAAIKLQLTIAATSPYGEPLTVDGVVQEDGDQDALFAELQTKSWCSLKQFATKEEAEAFIKSKEPN